MKVGSNNDADDDGDNAVTFDFFIGRNAIGEVFGDLAIEEYGKTAAQDNDKADNHPDNTEGPVYFHNQYYTML